VKNEVVKLSDADVRNVLLAYLREHGPTRAKTLCKRAGTPYERSLRVLDAMQKAGDIEQVPDGIWRGLPMHAWMIAGAVRPATTCTSRFAFTASETLAAMQQVARAALMRRAA
jgi:predicted ArsR family transcriptional regulator